MVLEEVSVATDHLPDLQAQIVVEVAATYACGLEEGFHELRSSKLNRMLLLVVVVKVLNGDFASGDGVLPSVDPL